MTRFLPTLLSVLLALPMAGCAVGKGPAGEIVVGVKAGEMVESAQEAAGAAAKAVGGLLPDPWGTVLTAGAALVLGGGGIGAAARKAKQREDAAWDESRKELLADLAIRKGANV